MKKILVACITFVDIQIILDLKKNDIVSHCAFSYVQITFVT